MKKISERLLFVVILLTITGCSTTRYVDRWHTKYVTNTVHHRDTVSTKDSVYIREWVKGDTVYVDRFRDRYFYRDRWRDSIQVKEIHDTTTIEKKVPAKLTRTQQAKLDSYGWLMAILLGLLIWTFRKPLLSLLKRLI